jgi:serine/threonine protein kinase
VTETDESAVGGRLVGRRTPYDAAPAAVHDWVAETLGSPVVRATPRIGGMSPAVAVSVRGENGATAFVKAVSPGINPDTPSHFRREIAVLTGLAALPPVPYRAGLLATYDDGDWVALTLEDVDGRHPDWTSLAEREAVFASVRQQMRELTPAPDHLPSESTRDVLAKYLEAMVAPTDEELGGLPSWAVEGLSDLRRRVELALEHERDEAFCHWDLRHDNILIRHDDSQPVLVDWGMSRRGRRWTDALVFGLEWVDSPDFDAIVSSLGLSADDERDVTAFLIGIGCYLAMQATQPAPPGLPTLPAFRRQVGRACLAGVRRRLDAEPRRTPPSVRSRWPRTCPVDP